MTKSGEQRLRALAIVVSLLFLFFYLEAGSVPGWIAGMAFLMQVAFCGILFAFDSNKFSRVFYIACSLFFLVFSIKNFLAR